MGIRSAAVVPLLRQSMVTVSSAILRRDESTVKSPLLLSSTTHPSALTALIAARVSLEKSGCRILDFPLAIKAMRRALIVWLFDAGIVITPLYSALSIVMV